VNRNLNWLHVSDIHFHPGNEWRDGAARSALLEYLRGVYEVDDSLRPDLIFCTGDIAFGETSAAPLAEQYEQARSFFDSLLAVCGRGGAPLPKERLFVVPGNHDVNRKSINSYAQATLTGWATESAKHAAEINRHFNDRTMEFTDAVKRLDEYARFVESYLPHQADADGRHCYARVVNVGGLRVGVAGFNSAWSCAGAEDDRTLWMAAAWQFNSALSQLNDADVRVGLMHHPVDWLNETDRDVATRRTAAGLHFCLHGHSHNSWVAPGQSYVTIAAGAVGAETGEEFGINIVSLDLEASRGSVYLHAYSPRDGGWAIDTVPRHAPDGRWRFDLPPGIRAHPPEPNQPPEPEQAPDKRTPGLFGRRALLKEAADKLQRHPFLLVCGLRGNGKSSLIEALGRAAPLAEKGPPVRYSAHTSTTADELFRQFATILGDTAEFPRAPAGNAASIAGEVRRRYPNPRPAWVWIEHAHRMLDEDGFFAPEVRSLLLGLQSALGPLWRWVFEFRERPARGLLDADAAECEVPGLDKASLAECLEHGAPPGREAEWRYGGKDLKGIYQWLGGGQGGQAHPLAIQLLIEVARGHDETPLKALRRHLGDFEQKIEERLLGDLYNHVLSAPEQRMLQALALYRSAIPHDHAETLERRLNVAGAWEGLDRRCLLSSNADHSQYYLHSFIAGWLRTRMGYAGHGEDAEADFAEAADYHVRQHARELHAAVAACWLYQLRGSRRITNTNITRALEAFHHLVAAGAANRVQDIAVELLAGNREWAIQRIERLYNYLHESKAPVEQLRRALEYAAILNPNDPLVQRFLGECWAKEEGRASDKALRCFENACRLRRDFPPYWANLGRTLLAQGSEGARDFLERLEVLREDCPDAINDHVQAIQSDCLERIGKKEQASALRMSRIQAGSRNPVFYNDEAKARMESGDLTGAIDMLDLAERNGCANNVTASIRTNVLRRLVSS
jgi:predicted MPP superfamily phosphohydrolase